MSNYNIIIKKSVYKDVENIPKNVLQTIFSDIKILETDPRNINVKKIKGSLNDYRLRSGLYRIIYKIYEKEKTIEIYRIRHRKDAY